MDECRYIRIFFSHTKKEILTFVITSINLEGIILREISQTKKDKHHMSLHVKFKNNENKTKQPNKNTKLVDTETRLGVGEGERKGGGR